MNLKFNQWVKDMTETRKEEIRVNSLNWFEIKENNRIRAENAIRKGTNRPLIQLLPLPYNVSSFAAKTRLRERKHRKKLKGRTPEQWVIAVKEVPAIFRDQVARICWWDFFGGEQSSKANPHLYEYLNRPYKPITDNNLIAGLFTAGYSPWAAVNRISGDDAE